MGNFVLSAAGWLCTLPPLAALLSREESRLPANVAAAHQGGLQRLLCIVVLVVIVLATIYAGWIGISNFSRIGV
jgi:hypothetical protein